MHFEVIETDWKWFVSDNLILCIVTFVHSAWIMWNRSSFFWIVIRTFCVWSKVQIQTSSNTFELNSNKLQMVFVHCSYSKHSNLKPYNESKYVYVVNYKLELNDLRPNNYNLSRTQMKFDENKNTRRLKMFCERNERKNTQ